jgi:hypothetical protein
MCAEGTGLSMARRTLSQQGLPALMIDGALLLQAFARSGVRIARRCSPELWHTYHGKNKWHESYDGKHKTKTWQAAKAERKAGPTNYTQDRTWVLPLLSDGANVLYKARAENTFECKQYL